MTGGFSLAAHWLGWETIAFCEQNDYCKRVLRKNFPGKPIYDDVREFNGKKYRGSANVVSMGFPCQDISNAKTWTTGGKFVENGLGGKRSGLFYEGLRIAVEAGAKYIVGENVPELTNKGLDEVLRAFSDVGYDAEWQIIPASFVGAPHLRKRIWIVAYPERIGRDEESIIFSRITRQTLRQTPQWELSGTICKTYGKKTLPESFGIYDGLPGGLHRSERIAALGNSIVPQIAYEIFKAIEAAESF